MTGSGARPGDPEFPADVASVLARIAQAAGPFASGVTFHRTLGSTSDEATRLAVLGAPEGTTVLANAQTAGRGRRGRRWHSPAGVGLYMSVVFRPPTEAGSVWSTTSMLTLTCGVAVAEAIRDVTRLPVTIKWPNDIVVERPDPGSTPHTEPGRARRRKLAGILAEAAGGGEQLQHVVVGIGVNLRAWARPADLADRATSIEEETSQPCNRAELVGAVLAALARWRARQRAGDTSAIVAAWRALAPASEGTAVRWLQDGRQRQGTTRGIDETGALLVATEEGIERIVAGELAWE
jgi:BirA family transcriptional regulator, biotin operon repressor / biotin---[acetyl-CoA-carboxylase] ligase